METVRVALMGGGTVGSAFAQLLTAHRLRFRALDVEVELTRVLVRDTQKSRPGHSR
jgi:homoserine dehydrogenase